MKANFRPIGAVLLVPTFLAACIGGSNTAREDGSDMPPEMDDQRPVFQLTGGPAVIADDLIGENIGSRNAYFISETGQGTASVDAILISPDAASIKSRPNTIIFDANGNVLIEQTETASVILALDESTGVFSDADGGSLLISSQLEGGPLTPDLLVGRASALAPFGGDGTYFWTTGNLSDGPPAHTNLGSFLTYEGIIITANQSGEQGIGQVSLVLEPTEFDPQYRISGLLRDLDPIDGVPSDKFLHPDVPGLEVEIFSNFLSQTRFSVGIFSRGTTPSKGARGTMEAFFYGEDANQIGGTIHLRSGVPELTGSFATKETSGAID